MKKNKILFILPFIPYPLNTGGNQAMYNGIKAIYNYADVHLTFEINNSLQEQANINILQQKLGETVKIIPYLRENTKEKISLLKKIHIFLWKIKMFLMNLFHNKQRYNAPQYHVWQGEYIPKDDKRVNFINDIIKKYNIDIVQCEMLQTASYALTLPIHVKKIFVHHEIGFIREELNVMAQTQEPEKYASDLEVHRKNEVSILNHFDTIITLSSIDKEKLQVAGVKVPIVASFAIVDYKKDINIESRNSHILTFVGPSCHNPNVVGIKWFLKNCWNQLKEVDSKYSLQIIGIWDENIAKELKSQYLNIEFKGFVEDLASAIQNTIMIVPITVGSGIRMKILEACLNGVPVVSTRIGAEGLPLVNGTDAFIVNTPEEFIEAVCNMKNEKTRIMFIKNARKNIINNYSLEALERNRTEILKNILNESTIDHKH